MIDKYDSAVLSSYEFDLKKEYQPSRCSKNIEPYLLNCFWYALNRPRNRR